MFSFCDEVIELSSASSTVRMSLMCQDVLNQYQQLIVEGDEVWDIGRILIISRLSCNNVTSSTCGCGAFRSHGVIRLTLVFDYIAQTDLLPNNHMVTPDRNTAHISSATKYAAVLFVYFY